MTYKESFIIFLAKTGAIRFGSFTLKSGRTSPYFITFGSFYSGENISKLGNFYADAITQYWDNVEIIYGPAYKGIPLCVSTVIALQSSGVDAGYLFNRKEKKDHGLEEMLVGSPVDAPVNAVLVDDVITSGTAIREALACLPDTVTVQGILVSVDRKERGLHSKDTALAEVQQDLSIPVYAIVDMNDVIKTLHNRTIDGVVYINDEMKQAIELHQENYKAQ